MGKVEFTLWLDAMKSKFENKGDWESETCANETFMLFALKVSVKLFCCRNSSVNPEYIGNLIIDPLFFEVTANQALIIGNNGSAFNVHDFYISSYPYRVALTVVSSVVFSTFLSTTIAQFTGRRQKEWGK